MNNYKSFSVQSLIAKKQISPQVLDIIIHELVEAIAMRHEKDTPPYNMLSQDNILLNPTTKEIEFKNLKPSNQPIAMHSDIALFGQILSDALATLPVEKKRLTQIAHDCKNGNIPDFYTLALLLERRISNTIYLPIIAIIIALLTLLYFLNPTN